MKTLLILTCLFAISFSGMASKNSSKAVHPRVIATQILDNNGQKVVTQKFDYNKKSSVPSNSISAKLFRVKTWRYA